MLPFQNLKKLFKFPDDGGASGFIAGRSVWKESIGMTGDVRTKFLAEVAVPRLEKLNVAVAGIARPYFEVGK